MAHEFGHAMQGRFGFAASGRSIQDETQADCLAGAWTRWVDDGKAAHVGIRTPELDDVVRGFLRCATRSAATPTTTRRTAPTSTASRPSTRASTAASPSCRDDFGPDRLYTAGGVHLRADFANQGNAPYADIVTWIDTDAAAVLEGVVPHAFGKPFRRRRSRPSTAPPPTARPRRPAPRPGLLPVGHTVYYDRTDLIRPAYE